METHIQHQIIQMSLTPHSHSFYIISSSTKSFCLKPAAKSHNICSQVFISMPLEWIHHESDNRTWIPVLWNTFAHSLHLAVCYSYSLKTRPMLFIFIGPLHEFSMKRAQSCCGCLLCINGFCVLLDSLSVCLESDGQGCVEPDRRTDGW